MLILHERLGSKSNTRLLYKCLSGCQSDGSVLYGSVGTESLSVTFKRVSRTQRTPLWKRFRQNQGESRQSCAETSVCVTEVLSHTAYLNSGSFLLPYLSHNSSHLSALVSLFPPPPHHLLHVSASLFVSSLLKIIRLLDVVVLQL